MLAYIRTHTDDDESQELVYDLLLLLSNFLLLHIMILIEYLELHKII